AGEESSLAFLTSHDVLFTYGENLGAPDCPVPLERFAWRTTRPPVVLDCWAARTDPGAVFFTSIASWENKGKDITFRGETYQWSKHVNFLRFLDLPRHTPQRFCLAMDPADAAVEARVRGGWRRSTSGPSRCCGGCWPTRGSGRCGSSSRVWSPPIRSAGWRGTTSSTCRGSERSAARSRTSRTPDNGSTTPQPRPSPT